MSFAGNNKVYNGTMLLENNRQNKAIQYCTHKQRYATDHAISNLAYLSKEHVIWLIFGWHKKNKKPIKELQTLQRCHTHVQEYSKQNRHGDVTQNGSYHYRYPDHQEDEDVSNTLFPAKEHHTSVVCTSRRK